MIQIEEITGFYNKVIKLRDSVMVLEDENEQLKKQVEKMKNCQNCKHQSYSDVEFCYNCDRQAKGEVIKDNWELEE